MEGKPFVRHIPSRSWSILISFRDFDTFLVFVRLGELAFQFAHHLVLCLCYFLLMSLLTSGKFCLSSRRFALLFLLLFDTLGFKSVFFIDTSWIVC